MNLVMRLIPSAMTGVLSPPDVSWNGPLKNYVRECYDEWWIARKQTFTKQGNLRAVDFPTLVGWIVDAWSKIST